MKRIKLKIDGLLLFYILCLGLLGLSWKYGLIELSESSPTELKETFDFEDNAEVAYHEEGTVKEVKVLNPSLLIHYSLNGGETFCQAGSQLNFDNLSNHSITNKSTSYRWRNPFDDGPKVTSVVAFLENTSKSTRSNYQVITSVKKELTNLPVIHMSVKESHLFDEFEGLMVLGAKSWNQADYQAAWWFRSANYQERGIEWERPAQFQYFEEGEMKEDQKCGIRISGNATRGFPQKSFRIYARKQYGKTKFKHKFFGKAGKKKYESLVLRMSGNDNTKTMFADLLMHRLAADANLLVQHGAPSLLFINGNFWGMYNLRERIDAYFIANYLDAKQKDITILEDANAELKSGSENDQEEFLAFIETVRAIQVVSEQNLEEISNEIDLDSYMDYIFFEAYYANNDWPDNNAICYKVKGHKWQWLLNDLDYSLAYPGVENLETNMFDRINQSESVHAILFNKLLTNNEFKSNFKTRCKENLESHLAHDKIQTEYDKLFKDYRPHMDSQIKRWRNIESMADWELNCENNLDFLLKRKSHFKQHLEEL